MKKPNIKNMPSKITTNFKNDFCHYRSPLGDRGCRGLLFLFFFLINLGIGFSQNTPNHSITQVYKITNEEAKELFNSDSKEIEDKYFHTLVETHTGSYWTHQTTSGYYLYVKAEKENLKIDVMGWHTISAIVLNNQRDLTIQVIDSLGNNLNDAEVYFGKKKLKYDKKIKAFQKKRVHKGGLLTVKAKGETVFYEVNDKQDISIFKKRYRRFVRSKVGWIATTPFRWVRKSWRFLKNGIKGYGWNWWIFKHSRQHKDKSHKGYIALNKPKYQPGDTVKVKGYFTTHKGKPVTKELHLKLYNRYNYRKPIFSIPLQPKTKGAYTYEFVLGDSLKLDQWMTLQFFYKKDKSEKNIMSHRFYYEDYQLDEVEYRFESNQKEYTKDEKVILLAEGKDKNGWTIPDGNVEIIAKPQYIRQFYEKEILIPDTLWQTVQSLNTRGETQIIFPKDKLPKVYMTIGLIAKFSNSNGELDTKRWSFDYDAKETLNEKIEVALEDEFIIARYFVEDKEVEKQALLYEIGEDNNIETESQIQLPYKKRVSPFIAEYSFETEKAESELLLSNRNHPANIVAYGSQTKDSILVAFLNPRRLPITYQLRTKNKLLTKGQSDKKGFQISLKNKNHKSVFLYYQYIWGDQSYSKEKPVHFYKNLLSIGVEQPKTVEPGEQIQLKIAVKNAKEQPAKNVNLTAGAINAQFDNLKNVKEPSISFKTSRKPFEYDSFQLEAMDSDVKYKAISSKWLKELHLDSSLFYQIRFPKQGVHFHYDTIISQDTFYQNIAQFAPYLVKNGKVEPIYLIYCNRQLVYYYDVNDNSPYSFIGQKGYNQITFRTRDFTYTIDSVLLKEGQKLELSIDASHYVRSNFKKHISRKPTSNELSVQEKDLLNKKIFVFKDFPRNSNIYLWQDENTIHQFYAGKNKNFQGFKVGPFYPNYNIRMLVQDGWNSTFRFESGFEYIVEKNRERLYERKLFKLKDEIILPKNIGKKQLGQIVHSPKDIKAKTSFLDRLSKNFIYRRGRIKVPHGNYQFKFENERGKDSTLFAIVLLENDSTFGVYHPNIRRIKYLQSKNYSLILFTPNGNYLRKEISIQANHLLFQDLNNNTFTIDSSRMLFNEIFTRFSEGRVNKEEAKLYLSKTTPTSDDLKNQLVGSVEVSGTLVDASGEALIGATVMVKGTTIGTTTDIDGNYSFFVPEGDYTLVFSYTGYSTQEINYSGVRNGREKINVSLEEGLRLEEVVVVGYGAENRKISQDETTTGSVITSQDIRNLPTRNINAIAAQTAGVSSSDEGDDIRVRGNLIGIQDLKSRETADFGFDDFQGGLELDDIQLRSQFSDYAYFQPNLITDQNGEAYFTVTFPDNITAWKTFVVGMDNKFRAGTQVSEIRAYKKMTAQLALPRFLVEGDETNIIGKSVNFTKDSFNITTAFKLGDEILKTNQAELKDALIEKTKISTPENLDSLSLSYLLATENYSDGEERSIPIFQKGVEEANGVFKILDDEKTFETEFDSNLGEVKIRIEESIVNVLLEDLEYLKNYPYGCNEQTASRLIALLLEKEVRQFLGENFEGEKKIIKAIRRLKKTQNADGSWGWWQNGKQNIWMTTYVLKALEKAKQSNYKTEALEKGLVFLRNELEGLQEKNLLNALLLFSEVQQNLDYQKYLAQLDSTQNSLYDKFAIAKIRQANDLEIEMDSILKWKKATTFGGWYFGEENYHWYNNSTQITLLAHDIFQQKNDSIAVQNIQNYFLSKRKKYGWRNTIESATILLAILPNLMKDEKKLAENNVQLTGAINQTVSEFPFEATFSSYKPLKINQLGNNPVFITAYQERWNRNPKKKEDIFKVQTYFTQADKKIDNLEASVAADLHVEVEVKEAADYVMIEIPIPAGCSYHSKPNNYFGRESHREYFKNRTAIFCESLPAGKYEFTIPLEPRFSGKYTLNPTKVEQMYFPVFYGRNEMEQVKIKE